MKKSKGLKQLIVDHANDDVSDYFEKLIPGLKDIFKDAVDVSISKYCPHLDKIILIKTNPPMCECMECINDMRSEIPV